MRIKLQLTLPDGSQRPTVITADATATIGEVARTLEAGMSNLPVPADEPLSLQRVAPDGRPLRVLPSRSLLVDTNLRSGQSVRVVRWSESDLSAGSMAAARLRVIAGPNAGDTFDLRLGPNIVGRDPECDVTLDDHLVSRRHARVVVTDKVDVVDMNSSDGILIDGSELKAR